MPAASPQPYCNPDKFSAECIAGVAWAAGFGRDRPTLERAVAVALAESSGRVKVHNGICCVGLWQINVKVHPYSTAQMQDPQQNANAAWKISNEGRNWKPWEAFTNGSYLLQMPAAKAGVTRFYSRNPSANPGPGGDSWVPDALERPYEDLQDLTGTVQDLVTFPAKVAAWISDRNNIIRVAKVTVGIGLAMFALYSLTRPVQRQVIQVAGQVVGATGAGKATKAASAMKKVT